MFDKTYQQRNPEKIKVWQKKYQQTPKGKFANSKRRAKQRDIEWQLSFDEWWKLWQDSGQWNNRGVGRGKYLLCRTNDVGPYSILNTRIDTWENNMDERDRLRGEGKYSQRGKI